MYVRVQDKYSMSEARRGEEGKRRAEAALPATDPRGDVEKGRFTEWFLGARQRARRRRE